MKKHTPGPWTVGIYDITPSMLERMKHKQVSVCQNTDKNPQGLLIALCGEIDPNETQNTADSLADACLIAAAPEMLKELEMNLEFMESLGPSFKSQVGFTNAVFRLKNLIKKAKGVS